MSYIECEKINDLLPEEELPNEELQRHWIDLYNRNFGNRVDLLPKWARICHQKYANPTEEDLPSDSESDEGQLTDTEPQNDKSSTDSNDSDEDVDPELRIRRHKDNWHQNIEDRLHCRLI